jgi:hypothetical protein
VTCTEVFLIYLLLFNRSHVVQCLVILYSVSIMSETSSGANEGTQPLVGTILDSDSSMELSQNSEQAEPTRLECHLCGVLQ